MKFCYNVHLFLPEQSKDLDPSYKMDLDFWECFGFFQNNHKDLDPSYKMDLDFWEYFRRRKLCLITKDTVHLNSNDQKGS